MNHPSEDDFEGWYAIRTKQYREAKVAEELAAMCIETYLPLERKKITHARRVDVVERPLLVRYVFARITLKGEFWRIKNANGVAGILSSSEGRALRVSERELNRLRDLVTGGAFDQVDGPKKIAFESGQLVRILEGPFTGFHGLVEKGGEARTFRVLALLFGRATPVEVEAMHLKAA